MGWARTADFPYALPMNTRSLLHRPLTRRSWAAVLLGWAFLLGSLASFPAQAQDRPAGSSTLFLVRHAEKSAINGDVPLSAEGRGRAVLLASMLRHAGVVRIYT